VATGWIGIKVDGPATTKATDVLAQDLEEPLRRRRATGVLREGVLVVAATIGVWRLRLHPKLNREVDPAGERRA
jgi:hypothetical protein